MRTRRTNGTRVVAGAVLAGAVVVLSGCAAAGSTPTDEVTSSTSQQLAAELNTALAQAGLPAVPEGTAQTLYGEDGGISCANVGELQQVLALSQFGNNSGNLRRVYLDPRVVAYDGAVISTYCPDALDAFTELVDGLDTQQTINS